MSMHMNKNVCKCLKINDYKKKKNNKRHKQQQQKRGKERKRKFIFYQY